MVSNLVLFSGTGPNRKNIRINPKILYNQFLSLRHGTPSFIDHDYHQLLGWMLPTCLMVNGGRILLYGSLLTPVDKNGVDVLKRYTEAYLDKIYEVDSRKGKIFLASLNCRQKVEKIRNIDTSLIAQGNNILYIEFPELSEKLDDDGLIDVSILNYLGDGVFKYKDRLLYPDRRYRRSCSLDNNLNQEFLNYYISLEGDFSKKIALDADIIGDVSTLCHSLEMDYWYGPKFNDDIMAIKPGVSKHVVPQDSPVRHINGIDSMEFCWSVNGENNKIFECEEIPSKAAFGFGEKEFGAKYMHGIFLESEACQHVDGAIRQYTSLKFNERTKSSLDKFGKNSEYRKLWRMDGRIPSRVYKDLCHYYFRSNSLVEEYFQGIISDASETEEKGESVLLPPVIGKFDDLIITAGFIDPPSVSGKRRILPQQEWDGRSFADLATNDLIKLFNRASLEICTEKLEFVDWMDMVVNIPSIIHMGDDSFADTRVTLEIVAQYLALLNNENLGSVVMS